VRTRLAVDRVIVYKRGGGWIRQGDPSLSTPFLNRACIFYIKNRYVCIMYMLFIDLGYKRLRAILNILADKLDLDSELPEYLRDSPTKSS
jgi:hypothetical protein